MERQEAAAGVVEHAVQHDPHTALRGRRRSGPQRLVAAQHRVDLEVIVGVVPVVAARGKHRVEVEHGGPQVDDVVEVFDDTVQVASFEAVCRRRRVPRFNSPRLARVRSAKRSGKI